MSLLNSYFMSVFTREKDGEHGELVDLQTGSVLHVCIRRKEVLEILTHIKMDKLHRT